jgi:hypothetical protein
MSGVSPLSQAALDFRPSARPNGGRFASSAALPTRSGGKLRFTEHADLSLLTGFGNEERFIHPLLRRFAGRRPDAADFAIRSRVSLLRHANGVALDVGLAAFPCEEATIARARDCEVPGGLGQLRVCGPEDFIIYKVFAGRDHDRGDVTGVLERQRHLNLELILRELPWLREAREDDGASLRRLEGLLVKYGHRS